MPLLYLDNNATTRVDDRVVRAMIPYFTEIYGNPSSAHYLGSLAKEGVERARKAVASFLGCFPEEVTFTSGGTEGDNAVLHSVKVCQPQRRHIVVSSLEHPAVARKTECMCHFDGFEATPVEPNRRGVITPEAIQKAMRPNTALVSVMLANNETGVVNPVADIAKVAKTGGALLHVDGTQAVGKIPINFRKLGADYFVFAGHKFHGLKGVGAVLVKRGVCFSPLMVGGSQEGNRRGGTENVPGIVGLGAACGFGEEALPVMASQVRALRDALQEEIVQTFRDGVFVVGDLAPRTPNTLLLAFKNTHGRLVQDYLSERGVCVGTGSACSCLAAMSPSATVKAMGVPEPYRMGIVRISLSKYQSPAYGGNPADLGVVVQLLKRARLDGALGAWAPEKAMR